jgi:hypothetical protein
MPDITELKAEALELIDSYLDGHTEARELAGWALDKFLEDDYANIDDERFWDAVWVMSLLSPSEPEDIRSSREEVERAKRVLLGLELPRPEPSPEERSGRLPLP